MHWTHRTPALGPSATPGHPRAVSGTDPMNTAQNLLILSVMLGTRHGGASRRYRDTVRASADDLKLELFMFLSLIAMRRPHGDPGPEQADPPG